MILRMKKLRIIAFLLGVGCFASSAQDGQWYRPGYAKELSQQGQVLSIVLSYTDNATESEREFCNSETISEGDVRRYLALADDVDVAGHDFSSYPCRFLISILMGDERWLLDLNVSGLGYLSGSNNRWHTIACGHACSSFMPSAGSDLENCQNSDDEC